jgi:hypothetical protein
MKWLTNLFGKDPKELFLSFDPQASTWRVVSWNLDLKDPKERQWVLEIHGDKKQTIHWMKKGLEEVFFFLDDKLLRKRRIIDKSELKALMNLSIHSVLKYGLESNHEFMLKPVSGATTMDFQTEARALQWIQASFGTLTRALDNFHERDDLILTGAVFSGIIPDSGERVLRVLAFNLDIFLYLQSDSSLQIVIFDDKNLGQGSAKTPTFQQRIKVTKPQFYDEIVKLVHKIAMVGEIK